MTKLSVPQQKLLERIRRCGKVGYLVDKHERRTIEVLFRHGKVEWDRYTWTARHTELPRAAAK